jgi:protease-4
VPLFQSTRPFEEKTIEGKGKNKILLIDISGIITSEKKSFFIGSNTEPDIVARIKEELDKAASDKKIKAIILKINSPGGTVTSSDIIYREILKFKKKTNVFVAACLIDIATSGGYYISNAADEIIAHPTTVTGSIGVIAMKFNIKGLMDKLGVTEESIKSGDKKDLLSPFRGITSEEQRIIQDIINSLHNQFLEVVKNGRKDISIDDLKILADGRVFTAGQALDYKLIDKIGYLEDAIKSAKKNAGLKDARVVIYHRPMVYKNNIYSQSSVNLFNFGENGLMEFLPVQFMYLWNP